MILDLSFCDEKYCLKPCKIFGWALLFVVEMLPIFKVKS